MERGSGGGSGLGQPGAITQPLLTLRSYIQTCVLKVNVSSFSPLLVGGTRQEMLK